MCTQTQQNYAEKKTVKRVLLVLSGLFPIKRR